MIKIKWQLKETDANLPLMTDVLGISEITANVMANRNLRTKKTAKSFLSPSMDNMHNVAEMKGIAKLLQRISIAIEKNQHITVFGDYDADGITSTAILTRVLQSFNTNVSYYIPHRQEEGYGLNINAIKKLAAKGTQLIIAVDNGISAIEEVDFANTQGIDVLIVDHHEPGEDLPNAFAIVDPKQEDCPYPFKDLCAGGLAYKVAEAICNHQNVEFILKKELLVLATIATLCDLVDLKDENRIIVNSGLAVLNANKLINPGLGSLIALRGHLEKPIDTFTIGFVIGPCLNASGRLENAEVSVELLLATDFNIRSKLAQKHIELNEIRKTLTAECAERVLNKLNMDNLDKILVITDKEAHESVAGIVAGRIKEATNRPTILLTQGENAMKGSGRSVYPYNIYEALYANKDLFVRFGGHMMAAGLTIEEENIPLLKEALNNSCNLTEEDLQPILQIDRKLNLEEVTLELADELIQLAPFGKANDEPLFLSTNVLAEQIRILDDKNTLIFTFSTQTGILRGIAFGLNEKYASLVFRAGRDENKTGKLPMDIVYTIEPNNFNGRTTVQVRIKDFKII